MKNLRITLAVIGGLLIATGYAVNSGQTWSGSKIFLGTMFGCVISWSWLNDPARSLHRGNVVFTTIMLSVLVLFAVWKESVLKAVLTTLFCLAFAIVHSTMARLYREELGGRVK